MGQGKQLTPPPRLHVVMRPGSPKAVVIRQGPSTTFCAIGWDLRRNKFEVGQWVKHKLYPERCDISPDGTWFLYFALNGRWSSETKGSWTGLSRVPYLKCVQMWPQGDTWGGGGVIDASGPKAKDVTISYAARAQRLARNGWTKARIGYEKPWRNGWTLRKRLERGFLEAHELISPKGKPEERYDWQWADIDEPRNRLVFADAGRIFEALPDRSVAHDEPRELFDATEMTFRAIAAPY